VLLKENKSRLIILCQLLHRPLDYHGFQNDGQMVRSLAFFGICGTSGSLNQE